MPKSTFIPLQCESTTLDQIATSLSGFALATLDTGWMVSAVYFQSSAGLLIASASIEVLRDGTIARPLRIAPPQVVLDELRTALPDVRHRIEARGFDHGLPDQPDRFEPPPMTPWFDANYSAAVLIRRIERHEALHRIASGLLFTRGDTGERLLIGSDVTTTALVASHDSRLIDRYVTDCDVTGMADYRATLA